MGIYTTVVPVFLIQEELHHALRWAVGDNTLIDGPINFPAALTPVTVSSGVNLWRGQFDMHDVAAAWTEFYEHVGWRQKFPKMPEELLEWRDRYTSDTNLLSMLTLAQMVPMKIEYSLCTRCAPIGEYVLVSGHMLHCPDPELAGLEEIPYWRENRMMPDASMQMIDSHVSSDGFYDIQDENMDEEAAQNAIRDGITKAAALEDLEDSGGDRVMDDTIDTFHSELRRSHSMGWRLPPITRDRIKHALELIVEVDYKRGTSWADWLNEAFQGYQKGMALTEAEEEAA